jgi:hypothetical protein
MIQRLQVLKAALLSGVLDALFATLMTLGKGGDVAGLWRGVASGPFSDAASGWGPAGALLGLGVHFALMLLMAAVLAALLRLPALARMNWVLLGLAYGLATYLIMYGLVLPWRFGTPFPQTDPAKIASALFAHVVLVGLVMAWVFKPAPRSS